MSNRKLLTTAVFEFEINHSIASCFSIHVCKHSAITGLTYVECKCAWSMGKDTKSGFVYIGVNNLNSNYWVICNVATSGTWSRELCKLYFKVIVVEWYKTSVYTNN